MKKLLLLLLLPIMANAQPPIHLVKKQPTSTIQSFNDEILKALGNNYKIVKVDTSNAEYKYRITDETNPVSTFVVVYFTKMIGANPDLQIAGNKGIYDVEIQGQFIPLFELYKKWSGTTYDAAEVSKAGRVPYPKDKLPEYELFRIDDKKGLWDFRM